MRKFRIVISAVITEMSILSLVGCDGGTSVSNDYAPGKPSVRL